MAKSKKKAIISDRELCEGVNLSQNFFEKEENRLFTLLLKGFIVYLLSMGSIGFYLSALNINYNVLLCHVVIGVMAIFCAMLYYRLMVENLGYLVLLILFGSLVFLFRYYINSGFYAIVNMTVDEAAQYFDVDIQKLYNEQIGDRYLTVTMVALFIGIVLDILLNVYISRRMQYVTVIFITILFNLIPLYLVCEPDLLYSVMMMTGIAMAYSFKSGKHYSPQISVKRNNKRFAEKIRGKKKNTEIAYVYDVKAMIQAGLYAVCVVLITSSAVSAFRPKDSFNSGYEGNRYKELSMTAVSTLMTDGLSGFFRNSRDVGGMDSGRLGDVSSIHLDHQTDLVVQLTPYSYDNVYLKSFTGQVYNPYENCWTNITDMKNYNEDSTPEADVLAAEYETGAAASAKGIMRVRNVGADVRKNYLPYYYSDVEYGDNGFYNITYYPYLSSNGSSAYIGPAAYEDKQPYTDMDLYVPEENMEAITQFVLDLDWVGTNEEVIYEVMEYFQENIPYTIKPGKTPNKKDFVNYFLTENRKGYCAHYASAATLIFRYLGIPARYVEGYVIDYYQITEGDLVEDQDYKDYYDGFSQLGETALVQVDVTDADAHAWVEVYLNGKGWCVVDVTPASGDTEEVEDFWSIFENVFGDSDSDSDGEITDGNGGFSVPDELIRKICYVILGIFAIILLVLFAIYIIKAIICAIRFRRAGINDKLIMRYSMFRRKLARKDKAFKEQINYRDQITWLLAHLDAKGQASVTVEDHEHGAEKGEKLIQILERAGFSNRQITTDEYNEVVAWLQHYKY